MNLSTSLSSTTKSVFWAEIAPSDQLVQIYTSDDVFLDSLEGFVSGGLAKGDGIVIIATPGHLSALNQRLTARGFNLVSARARNQYIALDADESLKKFIVKGQPDEHLFEHFLSDVLKRAGQGGRRVRAFGEMVALLWAHGNASSTQRLEALWHKICQKDGLSLFLAYPKSGFTQDTETSIRQICDVHSRLVGEDAT